MRIKNKKTGELIEVPPHLESDVKAIIAKGGDPMVILNINVPEARTGKRIPFTDEYGNQIPDDWGNNVNPNMFTNYLNKQNNDPNYIPDIQERPQQQFEPIQSLSVQQGLPNGQLTTNNVQQSFAKNADVPQEQGNSDIFKTLIQGAAQIEPLARNAWTSLGNVIKNKRTQAYEANQLNKALRQPYDNQFSEDMFGSNQGLQLMANGGQNKPIKGTKEQYQAYQDSLTSYNATRQFENKYPIVSNEESDRITGLTTTPNHLGLIPMGWYKKSDASFSPAYKKPVQPIIYQPEDRYSKEQAFNDSMTLYKMGVKNEADVKAGKYTPKSWIDFINKPLDKETELAWKRLSKLNGKSPSAIARHEYSNGDIGVNLFKKPIGSNERPKEQPINIQSAKPDLLQGSDINMFNPIPFEKGTYFTRERQSQEQSGGTDYFDKKTGKLMGTYKEYGGYAVGSEYEMDDAQIAKLRAMGYKIKVV